MSKARQEAQRELNETMQAQITDYLQRENDILQRKAKAADEGAFPKDLFNYDAAKFQGMIDAYRKLGFRTEV